MRLLFCVGDFHFTDADVQSWTLEEREIFIKQRERILEAWEKNRTEKKK